jgi:hypothetical protein
LYLSEDYVLRPVVWVLQRQAEVLIDAFAGGEQFEDELLTGGNTHCGDVRAIQSDQSAL